jgi:site-specific DNA-methyltransferase (adenine-specific)
MEKSLARTKHDSQRTKIRSSIVDRASSIYCGDNLDILRNCVADRSVDLIYADPPFNSGKPYHHTARKKDAPSFTDIWRFDPEQYQSALDIVPPPYARALAALFGLIGESNAMAYCVFLAPRLAEMQRVLKPTGSLYLHLDTRMSPYARIMLDAAFGRENFRNEIAWSYRTGGAGKKHFARKHDVILYFTASNDYTFHPQYERVRYHKKFFSAKKDEAGFYADVLLRDVWEIPAVINVSSERTGYPTQKPIALLERIVAASSNVGDVVLDPFCGSGTTLVAAKQLSRKWIGIDLNEEALAIAKERLTRD